MPISTPRGLKIRLEPQYAFALMARLEPRVSPFRVLKTTEGIDSAPGAIGLCVGLFCFIQSVPPLLVFKYVLIATLIAQVVLLYGIFIIPGLVSLGTAYSYVSGFGVLLVAIALTGLFLESWQAVAAFFVAKFAAAILGFVLELWEMRRIHRSSEIAFTASERAFVNAYRLHASRLGVSTDIDVPECEIESGKWRDALGRFAYEYPAVVQRFAI